MLELFSSLRSFSLLAVTLRMLLSMICGGIIGIEREYKRRPAGFRTHILICMGAAMTTLTSQYLVLYMGYYTDPARLGAQVVAGVGFIGAGCIIVTRHQRVKGLTTAAGLWVSAIVGLALGSGFYEAALLATALVLISELFLAKLEYAMVKNAQDVNLYMEYKEAACLDQVLRLYREQDLKVLNLEITRSADSHASPACALFTLRLSRKISLEEVLARIDAMEGVVTVNAL